VQLPEKNDHIIKNLFPSYFETAKLAVISFILATIVLNCKIPFPVLYTAIKSDFVGNKENAQFLFSSSALHCYRPYSRSETLGYRT